MTLEEFHASLRQDILARADAESDFTASALTDIIAEQLVESGDISDFTACMFKRPGIRIDGYDFSRREEGILDLFVTDYRRSESLESISRTEIDQNFKRLATFFMKSLGREFPQQLEESMPAWGIARQIHEEQASILRVRFFLFTNANRSSAAATISDEEMAGRTVSYQVWDIDRLYKLISSARQREDIIIDFREMFGRPLPGLKAEVTSDDLRSYLAVIPGEWLARIYEKYGGRLLEQNVRTFLQVRGSVNKGILRTIREEPGRFFAYNNGISATAEVAEVEEQGSSAHILSLQNFQIVNGGQTTASIYNAFRKFPDARVGEIFVQMKISVVTPENADRMVPNISRYANSQNRISDADFFSNHPFHVRMEELSRRIWAPAIGGAQIQTHWFYERAKGQYANAQAYLTPARKREFQLQNPRGQLFTKTDIAKFDSTFRRLPYEVSRGAQKNFSKFAEHISKVWADSDAAFNETWFRHAVAKAIIFRAMEKMVQEQEWYAGGYRANIVTYGIALLVDRLNSVKREIDLDVVWRNQAASPALMQELAIISQKVHDRIISDSAANGVSNVTEWCKRPQCWDAVQRIDHRISEELIAELNEAGTAQSELRQAKRTQQMDNEIGAEIQVANLGADHWRRLLEWGRSKRIFSPADVSILTIATSMPRKVPTGPQSNRLMQILKKAADSGFS